MTLGVFDHLPENIKRKIVDKLLSDTVGVEFLDRGLPIGWLCSDFDSEDYQDDYTEPQRSLEIDTYVIERVEPTNEGTYLVILLASYWKLADVVRLRTLNLDSGNSYTRFEQTFIPGCVKISFEDFRKYLSFCCGLPIELDPFQIKEHRDLQEQLRRDTAAWPY